MTIRTIKTSGIEADHIMNEDLHHIFRSTNDHIRAGDVIQFQVYRDGKPALHTINSKTFRVTIVQDKALAPVGQGWQVIGFRRIA